jgi:hypothetical protein
LAITIDVGGLLVLGSSPLYYTINFVVCLILLDSSRYCTVAFQYRPATYTQ